MNQRLVNGASILVGYLLVAASFPPLASVAGVPQITWTEGPEYPMGIQDSACGIVHGKLISAGGFSRHAKDVVQKYPDAFGGKPDGFTAISFQFDPAKPSDGWTRIPDIPGPPRQAALSAVVNNELYAIGGFNYTAPYSYRSTYRLNRDGGKWVWTDTRCEVPWPVCQGSAVTIGSRIYLIAAADFFTPPGASVSNFYTEAGRDRSPVSKALLVLDTKNLKAGWKRLADFPGVPRAYASAEAAGGKLYVLGGLYAPLRKGEAALSQDLNEWYYNAEGGWVYDPAKDKWTKLKNIPDNANVRTVSFKNRYLVLMGGFKYAKTWQEDGSQTDAYTEEEKAVTKMQLAKKSEMAAASLIQRAVTVYDTVTDRFHSTAPLLDPSAWPMATIDGNTIYCFGGEGGTRLWHPSTFQIGRIAGN